MPERYYYSKNNALLGEKLQAIEESQLRHKAVQQNLSMGRPVGIGKIKKSPLHRN